MMAFTPVITGCKSGKECEPPITSLKTTPGACVQYSSLLLSSPLTHSYFLHQKVLTRENPTLSHGRLLQSGTPKLIIPIMTSSASAHWVE